MVRAIRGNEAVESREEFCILLGRGGGGVGGFEARGEEGCADGKIKNSIGCRAWSGAAACFREVYF